MEDQDPQETFFQDFDPQFQGNDFILASNTIAKDKALETWICDSESACMLANIFISHWTQMKYFQSLE